MSNKKSNMDFNFLTAVIVLLFGIIYSLRAYSLPRASIGSPMAPSIYPLLLGGSMIVLGLILLMKSSLQKTKESIKEVMTKATENEIISRKMIKITCIVSIVYALLFDHLGYIISTFLFLQSMLFLTNGKKKWVINTIVSISFSIGIYVIFSKLLGISLPPIPYLYI
ncbi:tripartite tricarboxylate transporter TctB family protein [Anaeromicrobium sediminis]|uniref:DUF1468 domain-containing protein n=1 Tax=Anaeromicrobium sediminis TaxID=1478221 RepID=A0A267MF00_9FIRM|nr:tripartite tricarboxylate transporter TctB family protein [Anaeromicrobium sediminis]PAB57962.1 hypothetical protein CCE28_17525 [Anaeromicrobium sediminis]